jgi:hypothetical protein
MSVKLVNRAVLVLVYLGELYGVVSLVVDSATSEPMQVRIGGPLPTI